MHWRYGVSSGKGLSKTYTFLRWLAVVPSYRDQRNRRSVFYAYVPIPDRQTCSYM